MSGDRRNWDNCIVAGTRTVKKDGVLRIEGENFKFEKLIIHVGVRVYFEINRNIGRNDGYRYSVYTSPTLNVLITEKDF